MANIKDVAKLAGVSVSAVSKTYNDYEDISPETKKKIFDAAQKLGYIPNKLASNLSSKNKKTVGIIINPNPEHQYIDEISMLYTVSIVEAATENNFEPYVILSDIFVDMNANEFVNFLYSKGIKSLIIFGLSNNDFLLKGLLQNNDFYKVIVDAQIHNSTTASVSIDNLEAQYVMFKKVYETHGFKKYMYISGSQGSFVSMERIFGVNKFINDYPDVNVLTVNGDFNSNNVLQILENNDLSQFECIICASDMMAIQVQKYLGDSDILVCGFDNIGLLKYTYPNMPTINQDFRKKGHATINALIQLSENETGEVWYEPFEIVNI